MPAEFEDDPDLYVLKPIKYVGIEVWQVGAKTFCSSGFQTNCIIRKNAINRILQNQLGEQPFCFLSHVDKANCRFC